MPSHSTGIEHFNKLVSQMRLERQSFITHYKDLQQFIAPRKGRFFITDRNKGAKRHQAIINSAGTQALRIGTAGMFNGTMNPSRPWFGLETFNPDLMESQDVRDWLYKVEIILRTILNDGNFYNMVPVFLKELLLFGTSFMTHVDDFEHVARFYTHTAGSYMLAQNDRLVIDTVAREYEWPVIQIVKKFGLENISKVVRDAYDNGNYSSYYPLVHFIQPNEDYKEKSPLGINKAFISVYYEPGNTGIDTNKFLSKGGFDTFPGYAGRWEVTEGDIYGVDCPGMTSLGDVKQLQIEEKRKAQAIDKMVNPPLQGPPNVRNVAVSGLPGSLVIYEGDNTKQRLEPVYTVDPRLQELRLDMDAVERRINSAFFVDLFMAITQMQGIQPKNQLDLTHRDRERLTQLGPVLERLQGEFQALMLDRLFNQCVAADILPPAPEELVGQPLNVRFISTLAMAQKAIVTTNIEKLAGFTSSLVQTGWPTAADKFDADQAIDEYSRAIGVPPTVVLSDEDVASVRQTRAEQEQQQLELEQIQQIANVAKTGKEVLE